jgi:hypothetical protein
MALDTAEKPPFPEMAEALKGAYSILAEARRIVAPYERHAGRTIAARKAAERAHARMEQAQRHIYVALSQLAKITAADEADQWQ